MSEALMACTTYALLFSSRTLLIQKSYEFRLAYNLLFSFSAEPQKPYQLYLTQFQIHFTILIKVKFVFLHFIFARRSLIIIIKGHAYKYTL